MILEHAKIMKNNTICIPKKARTYLNLQKSDNVIITAKNHYLMIKKAPNWKDLLGMGKKTFSALGGGEKFLKKERASWGK